MYNELITFVIIILLYDFTDLLMICLYGLQINCILKNLIHLRNYNGNI